MTIQLPDGISSTLLSDVGARALPSSIKPLISGMSFFGPALTVEVPLGDNLAVHAALSMAQPGEVLLIEAGGHLDRAIMGDIMCTQASALQLAGVVINGAVRDCADLQKMKLAIFAKGATPVGPGKQGPGKVLHPVVLGSVHVNPGDYVYGDDDGVVVFTPSEAPQIFDAALKKKNVETARLADIAQGRMQPHWLAEALRNHPISIADRKPSTP